MVATIVRAVLFAVAVAVASANQLDTVPSAHLSIPTRNPSPSPAHRQRCHNCFCPHLFHTHTHSVSDGQCFFAHIDEMPSHLHRCWHQHSSHFAPWTTCFFRASGVHSPLTSVRESRDRICNETRTHSGVGRTSLLCARSVCRSWGSVCALVLHQWLLGCVWW
jgi:hypothetical protein